jgi:DNA-binding CsgD family transcriptional regulator
MSAVNKELSRRFTDLFSTGDEALADGVLSSEVVMHGSVLGGELDGRDAVKGFVAMYRAAFPDNRSTVQQQIAEGDTVDLAPILMMAYGLTNRERTITSLVCRGFSTREIEERLHITPNTIQDHLKSIFNKTGVRTRRELAMSLLQRDYLPRTMAGTPIGPSGFFVE